MDRQALRDSLQEGRPRAAGRIALDLARRGAWDSVVAAAIHLHAPAAAPERAAAAAWIEALCVASLIADDPFDDGAWIALFDALIDGGRLDELFTGMRLARDAGLLTPPVLAAVGRGLIGLVLSQ